MRQTVAAATAIRGGQDRSSGRAPSGAGWGEDPSVQRCQSSMTCGLEANSGRAKPGGLQSRLQLALSLHTSFPRRAVIPAHAGIQGIGTDRWIPDTRFRGHKLLGNDRRNRLCNPPACKTQYLFFHRKQRAWRFPAHASSSRQPTRGCEPCNGYGATRATDGPRAPRGTVHRVPARRDSRAICGAASPRLPGRSRRCAWRGCRYR